LGSSSKAALMAIWVLPVPISAARMPTPCRLRASAMPVMARAWAPMGFRPPCQVSLGSWTRGGSLASVARKRSRPCLCRNSLMPICINTSPPGRGAFWPPSPDVGLQGLFFYPRFPFPLGEAPLFLGGPALLPHFLRTMATIQATRARKAATSPAALATRVARAKPPQSPRKGKPRASPTW
jgi:hypothetical protein